MTDQAASTPASKPDDVKHSPFKRICALSDGTWRDAESKTPTNILKLTKTIAREDANGVQQVVFYDAGLGTADNSYDFYVGGFLGVGIDLNIQQLYTFLCLNYDAGDEVYLFGFSRGAYTVRSLAGFIHTCGLVRRRHLDKVGEAYKLYRTTGSADNKDVRKFREDYGERIKIKLLCCFDTVGSLGVPETVFGVSMPKAWKKQYEFHSTEINEDIENAIHCLSIDEERNTFAPTPMCCSPSRSPSQVIARYFWGDHSGVGGGAPNSEAASNTTLFFVLSEMRRRHLKLTFDKPGPDDQVILPTAYPEPETDYEPPKHDFMYSFTRMVASAAARVIPSIDDVHWTACRRVQKIGKWRPEAVKLIESKLMGVDWEAVKKKEEEANEQEEEANEKDE